jgi:hypothetical protein
VTSAYDDREALDLVINDKMRDLHTSFPAQVLAYNATLGTLEVRPALKREAVDEDGGLVFETISDLYGIPIMWPRGGGYVMTFPIAVGDWVLIHCAEQSTLVWRRRGIAPSSPGFTDPHGLNGCVAVPGWYPDTKRTLTPSTTDLVIGSLDGSTTIKVKPGGTVTLGSDVGAQPVALAELVRLAVVAAITGHTHVSAEAGNPTANGVLAAPLLNMAATKVKAV